MASVPLVLSEGAAEAAPKGVPLAPETPRTEILPTERGVTFYTATIEVSVESTKGLRLSSTPDGTGQIFTDDAMDLSVTRSDKTGSISVDFSGGCLGGAPRPPLDVRSLFREGKSTVKIRLSDRCAVAYSSFPYYLSGKVKIRSAVIERQLGVGTNPASFGDPVNLATGNFSRTETDLDFPPHVFGLTWARTYNSLDDEVGPFGQGWSTTFTKHVAVAKNGTVSFTDGDGRTVDFVPSGAGYLRPAQLPGELRRDPTGRFLIRWFDGRLTSFDGNGRLASEANWDGQEVHFLYDGDQLRRAEGSYGYHIDFEHDATGQITSAGTNDGRRVSYGSEEGSPLGRVTDASGATVSYLYGESGRLERVVDPEGRVIVALGYDADGRVASQQTAAGERSSFSYRPADGSAEVHDVGTGAIFGFRYDDAGQLLAARDPAGAEATRRYDAAGNLVSAAARDGVADQQTYDDHGNLTSITSPGGATTRFSYDGQDRLVERVDPLGASTRYAYQGNSRIPSTVTDPAGGVARYDLEGGRITAITDADGVTTRYGYDDASNLTSLTDGEGGTTRFEYDAAGRRIASISATGATERRQYDAAGRMVRRTDPTGGITTYRYSVSGQLLEETDPAGGTTTSTYDAAGLLSTSTAPDGGVTRFEYDDAGDIVARTDPIGAKTRFAYDDLGRLLSETDPLGAVTRHEYGPDGELLGTVDRLGKRSTSTFDERGNPVASTDAVGGVTHRTYDLADRVVAEIDPTGGERRSTYDPAGRLTTETDAGGAVTKRRWSATGRILAVEDPRGHTTRYAYDKAGRLTSTTSPGGGETRYAYDADGLLFSVKTPAGLETRSTYDPAGRVIGRTDPSGGVTRTEYSPRGEPVALIAPGGSVRRFTYDPAGRLIAAIDADGGVTRRSYDLAGHLTSLTDAHGGMIRYRRDLIGQETERIDQLGRSTKRAYDADGRLTSVTLATGERVDLAYDPAGRLLTRSAPGQTVRYRHDAAGRRLSMEDSTGTTGYTYDAAGRLATTTAPDGSATTNIYDAAGQLAALQYPSGRTVSFLRDPDGRLIKISDPNGGRSASQATPAVPAPARTLPRTISWHSNEGTVTLQLAASVEPAGIEATFDLDPDGRLVREALPDGTVRTYEYPAGNLARFSEAGPGPAPPVRSTVLERDADGRTVTETTGGQTVRYSYDRAGQLTGVTGGPGGPSSFEYDPDGNRTALTQGGKTTRSTYDAAHQLVQAGDGARAVRYAYDAAGRLTGERRAGEAITTTYSPLGDIATRSTMGGPKPQTRTYTHDGDGLLVGLRTTPIAAKGQKQAAPVDIGFRWSAGPGLPQILSQSGPGGADFLYGYSRLLAVGQELAVFSHDTAGSTLETQPTRPWARARAYDPFGAPATGLQHDGTDPSFGYRGELSVGNDLFLRARLYDPDTGRFTTPDPLDGIPGEVVSANPYHYADNDPLNQVDPTGLRPTDGDYDAKLALPDAQVLIETGQIQAAGFPFHLFNPWHRATQEDLANRVRGRTECFIPGAGKNPTLAGSHGGFADVCTQSHLWEVKYFGPDGLRSARRQLRRYLTFDPRRAGPEVAPSTFQAAGAQIFAFSPEAGIRLYIPVPWIGGVLQRNPDRADLFRVKVPESIINALGVRLPNPAGHRGFRILIPHIPIPRIPFLPLPGFFPEIPIPVPVI